MGRFVLLGAVFLSGCARNPVTEAKVDPELATLVPADTVLLAGVHVEALEKTLLYQKYLADLRFQPVDDFAKQTGVDPRKDLSELLFVSNGKQGVLLGRGKFAGGESRRGVAYKGFQLIGNEQTAVVFINSSTAAAGEPSALRSLIDQRSSSHGPPPAMAASMKEIPPESQIWAAYTGSPVNLGFGGNVTKVLGSLEHAVLFFDLRAGLNGVASGLCSNEQGAQDVEGGLKLLIGMGRLSAPSDQPDMLRVYDGIRVTREARRVRLSIDEPPDLVKKVVDLWMKQ
jgi:hypothetical protein